jgi:phosphocarrier protein FPr
MVSLVLVSHSLALAESVRAFVREMADEAVRIAVAAGTGDDGTDFGTDALAIKEAIESVPGDDGVLVLVDVGSAILSTEMALEFLDEEQRAAVRLCPAPFVEGALAAAVQAGLGSSLDAVCREARSALSQKAQHLGEMPEDRAESDAAEPEPPSESAGEAVTARVTVRNAHGLHARPAARFVRAAGSFEADVTVANRSNGRGPVSARSITGVATLGAVGGHEVELSARGPEAETAVAHLRHLIESGFGETDEPEAAPPSAPEPSPPSAPEPATEPGALTGVPVSPGFAVAPVFHFRDELPSVPEDADAAPETAWEQLSTALTAERDALEHSDGPASDTGPASDPGAAWAEAQAMLLDDPDLLDRARQRVFDGGAHPARAWLDATEAVAAAYESLDDAYQQQRAADARDAGRRIARRLLGTAEATLPTTPHVLVAADLPPTAVTRLQREHTRAIVCAHGSALAHSAILLRAQGTPAVFGAGEAVLALEADSPLGVDAVAGRLYPDPSETLVEELEGKRDARAARDARLRERADEPAVTPDGVTVEVAANVSSAADAAEAARHGADGVGLLRTEVLFGQHDALPDEAAQTAALAEIAGALGERPLTVRAFDVGGDKPLPYLVPPSEEANPFLGVRGIRLLLRHPDVLRTQLRAVLRVAADHPLRLMFPMIATPDELREAKSHLDAARDALGEAGVAHGWPIPVGIMVETPSCALVAPRLAPDVDFLSVGTNDLTQYTMAADRGNAALHALADPLHPAVLHLIRHAAEAGREADVWTGVCGEAAADALAVPVLLGLGVTELSVPPRAVPRVKALVRACSTEDATALARDALATEDAAAVRRLSTSFLQTHAPDLLDAAA